MICELKFEVQLLSQIPAVFSQPSEEKIVVFSVFSLRIVCLCFKSVLPPVIFVVMHVGLFRINLYFYLDTYSGTIV